MDNGRKFVELLSIRPRREVRRRFWEVAVVFARGHHVEDDAQAVEVRLRGAGAFGRDEAFGPDEAAGFCGAGDQTDVGEFGNSADEDDVGRFDVAMDEVVAVEFDEGLGEGDGNL